MPRGNRIRVVGVIVLAAATIVPASVSKAGAATGTPPVPASLSGVTCTSDTSCFAVGTRPVGSYERTLVKHWNGATWTVVPTPNPPGKINAELIRVGCTSDTYCI